MVNWEMKENIEPYVGRNISLKQCRKKYIEHVMFSWSHINNVSLVEPRQRDIAYQPSAFEMISCFFFSLKSFNGVQSQQGLD